MQGRGEVLWSRTLPLPFFPFVFGLWIPKLHKEGNTFLAQVLMHALTWVDTGFRKGGQGNCEVLLSNLRCVRMLACDVFFPAC